MARGGLAGIWDRNKKWLTPLAELAAGAIGGPGAAALLGAGIGGLDRPGQRGIGLDVGGAVKGGVSGYGMGGLGSAAKTGISSLLTAGAQKASAAAPALTAGIGENVMSQAAAPFDYGAGTGIGFNIGGATPPTTLPSIVPATGKMAGNAAMNWDPSIMPSQYRVDTSYLSKSAGPMSYFKENKDIFGNAIDKGLTIWDQLDKRNLERKQLQPQQDAAQLARDKFEYEKQLSEQQRLNRQRLTQLLLPSLSAQLSQLQPRTTP